MFDRRANYLFLGLAVAALLLLSCPWAWAHKVNIFAYADGDRVYTESYFNDGRKCRHSRVEVFDPQGKKLLEGTTDNEGRFSFKVPYKTDLKIVLRAGMGHGAEYLLSAQELGPGVEGTSGSLSPQADAAGKGRESAPQAAAPAQVDLDQMRGVMEKALDEKLKPVMRLLARLQEKDRVSLSEVVGGIGYIVGLMGLVLYLKSRKTPKDRGG